jgi:hypothetical protein
MSNPTQSDIVYVDPNSTLVAINGIILPGGTCVNRTSFQNDDPKLTVSGLGKPGQNVRCPPNYNPLALTTPTHYAIQAVLNLAAAYPNRSTSGFSPIEIFIEMNNLAGTPVALDVSGNPAKDASGNYFSTVQSPTKDANGQPTGQSAPLLTYSAADVTSLLAIQTTQGVFCSSVATGNAAYLVNGFMSYVNPDNLKYDRPMGCSGNYTFFTNIRDPAKVAAAAAADALAPAVTRRALNTTSSFQELQRQGRDPVSVAASTLKDQQEARHRNMYERHRTASDHAAKRRSLSTRGIDTSAVTVPVVGQIQDPSKAVAAEAEAEIKRIQAEIAAKHAAEMAELNKQKAALEARLKDAELQLQKKETAPAPAVPAQIKPVYTKPSREEMYKRLDADGVYHLPYAEMLAGEAGETLVFPQGTRSVEVVFPDGTSRKM